MAVAYPSSFSNATIALEQDDDAVTSTYNVEFSAQLAASPTAHAATNIRVTCIAYV